MGAWRICGRNGGLLLSRHGSLGDFNTRLLYRKDAVHSGAVVCSAGVRRLVHACVRGFCPLWWNSTLCCSLPPSAAGYVTPAGRRTREAEGAITLPALSLRRVVVWRWMLSGGKAACLLARRRAFSRRRVWLRHNAPLSGDSKHNGVAYTLRCTTAGALRANIGGGRRNWRNWRLLDVGRLMAGAVQSAVAIAGVA